MNDLTAAEIPIPEGFHGQRRSYTLSLEGATGSVGVLWAEKQFYVSNSKGGNGLRINNKGGTTVSVKKCGGWAASWALARSGAGL